MEITRYSRPYLPFKQTDADQTATSFTYPVPTVTTPSGGFGGDRVTAELVFVGTGAAGTFTAQLIKWSSVISGSSQLWIPTPVLQVTGTLGATTGVDSSPVDDSYLFATNLEVDTGFSGITSYEITNPGNDQVAMLGIDMRAAEKWTVLFKCGTATAMNYLVRT